jgi:hypothetical protein
MRDDTELREVGLVRQRNMFASPERTGARVHQAQTVAAGALFVTIALRSRPPRDTRRLFRAVRPGILACRGGVRTAIPDAVPWPPRG